MAAPVWQVPWTHLAASLRQRGWPADLINRVGYTVRATFLDSEKFRCADNLRLARVDNPKEIAAYKNQINKGCCGYFDEVVIVHGDGKVHIALVGFNYDH